MASPHPGRRRAVRSGRDPREAPRQPEQRDPVGRRAAAVDARRGRLGVGVAGDGVADGDLQRVRRARGRSASATGWPHRSPAWPRACRSSCGTAGSARRRPPRGPAWRRSGRAIAAGHCRARSSSPAAASTAAARSTCTGSPLWLAEASATVSSGPAKPASSRAIVWIGFSADRGNTGASTSPVAAATDPSAASSTSRPRWRDSTKPLRRTSSSRSSPGLSVGEL